MPQDVTGEHYWQASIWLLEFLALAVGGLVVGLALGENQVALILFVAPFIVLFPLTLFWFYAIWTDGALLREHSEYAPRRWVWLLAGGLLSPWLVAPLYILRRRSKVGLGEIDWFVVR